MSDLLRNIFKLNNQKLKEPKGLQSGSRAELQVKTILQSRIHQYRFVISWIFLLVLFTFALTEEISAKTIYVAKNGNDRNAGTLSQPLSTPAKAIDIASPGDIIYLR